MCIAILKPANVAIGDDVLTRCFQRNSDGGGYMYTDSGRVVIRKGFFTIERFMEAYHKDVEEHGHRSPFGIHFRIATSGKVDKSNGHPHRIAHDCGLIHNGILPLKVDKDSTESDTAIFVRAVVRNLPPDWRDYEAVPWLIDYFCGYHNKMVFLWGDGRHLIINEKKGEWHEGVWYSHGGFREYAMTKYDSRLGLNGYDDEDYESWNRKQNHKHKPFTSNGVEYTWNKDKNKYTDKDGRTWGENNPAGKYTRSGGGGGSSSTTVERKSFTSDGVLYTWDDDKNLYLDKDGRSIADNLNTKDTNVVGFTPGAGHHQPHQKKRNRGGRDSAAAKLQQQQDESRYRPPTTDEVVDYLIGEIDAEQLFGRGVSAIALGRMRKQRDILEAAAARLDKLRGEMLLSGKVSRIVRGADEVVRTTADVVDAEIVTVDNGEPCEECGNPISEGTQAAKYGHCLECWRKAFDALGEEERAVIETMAN